MVLLHIFLKRVSSAFGVTENGVGELSLAWCLLIENVCI